VRQGVPVQENECAERQEERDTDQPCRRSAPVSGENGAADHDGGEACPFASADPAVRHSRKQQGRDGSQDDRHELEPQAARDSAAQFSDPRIEE